MSINKKWMAGASRLTGTLAIAAAVLMSTFSPGTPTAQALEINYPVYFYKVCNDQGHFGASYYNGFSPYSWYCYDLSLPTGVTFTGGLDINGWCMRTYRYSHAQVVDPHSAYGWKCVADRYPDGTH